LTDFLAQIQLGHHSCILLYSILFYIMFYAADNLTNRSRKSLCYDVDKSNRELIQFYCEQDGRLRVDDQLLEVNNTALLGLTNVDAMETLRQSMQKDNLVSNSISLVIARPRSSTRLAVTRPATATEPASTQKTAVSNLNLMPPPSTTKVLSTRKRQVLQSLSILI